MGDGPASVERPLLVTATDWTVNQARSGRPEATAGARVGAQGLGLMITTYWPSQVVGQTRRQGTVTYGVSPWGSCRIVKGAGG